MPSLALAANVRATSVWNCVARTIVHGTPERPDRLLLRELGLVVAPADAVDADDRDADVMLHARLGRGAQEPRGAVDEHLAVAVGGVETTSTPSSAAASPLPSRRSTGIPRRAPRQHAHLVPAPLELARRLGADGSVSTHDRDSHGARTEQARAM